MSRLSLLDIGPLTTTIKVRGQDVTVYGISVEGIFYMMSRFVKDRTLLAKARNEADLAQIIASLGADAISTVCAAATINREEFPDYSAWLEAVQVDAQAALRLSPSTQLTIIQEALQLTFEEGVGPFVEKLTSMLAGMGIFQNMKGLGAQLNPIQGEVLPTEVEEMSKGSVTASLAPSSAALDTGTTGRTRGTLHPDNLVPTPDSSNETVETTS